MNKILKSIYIIAENTHHLNALDKYCHENNIHLLGTQKHPQNVMFALEEKSPDFVLISSNLLTDVLELCQKIYKTHHNRVQIIILSYDEDQKASKSLYMDVGVCDVWSARKIFGGYEDNFEIIDHQKLNSSLDFLWNAEFSKQKALKAAQSDSEAPPDEECNIDDYTGCDVLIIGASTGGVRLGVELLLNLDGLRIPIIITQHLSSSIENIFAINLTSEIGKEAKLASRRTLIKDEDILLMPASQTLEFKMKGTFASFSEYPCEASHRPSINDTLHSALKVFKRPIAVILSGLGNDGTKALAEYATHRAPVMVLEPKLAPAPSMNLCAIETGLVSFVGSIEEIAEKVKKLSLH